MCGFSSDVRGKNKKKLGVGRGSVAASRSPSRSPARGKAGGGGVGGGGGGGLSRRNSKASVNSGFPGMWTDDGKYLTQGKEKAKLHSSQLCEVATTKLNKFINDPEGLYYSILCRG